MPNLYAFANLSIIESTPETEVHQEMEDFGRDFNFSETQ
jgi:hypothetical protein